MILCATFVLIMLEFGFIPQIRHFLRLFRFKIYAKRRVKQQMSPVVATNFPSPWAFREAC